MPKRCSGACDAAPVQLCHTVAVGYALRLTGLPFAILDVEDGAGGTGGTRFVSSHPPGGARSRFADAPPGRTSTRGATRSWPTWRRTRSATSSPSIAGDDPQGRPVRHGARAGGVRHRLRPRWRRCRHLVAVGASPPPSQRGADHALATTSTEELLGLPFLQPDQVTDSLHAYQLSKRGNSLRVMAEAVRWGRRGARINTISPGIIMTPLAKDELTGPRGEGYRHMIELSVAGRGGHGGRATHGPGRRVHHRQRLSGGRRSDRRLLVRRARAAVNDPWKHFRRNE